MRGLRTVTCGAFMLSMAITMLASAQTTQPANDADRPNDTGHGIIRATLHTDAEIKQVWAVQRFAKKLTTSQGEEKDIGLYARQHAGRIVQVQDHPKAPEARDPANAPANAQDGNAQDDAPNKTPARTVKIAIENLPVHGRYELRIATADGGIVQGWDATVPESDYVGDPPLEKVSRSRILEKQLDDDFTAFADRVRVLDIQGNIQNAAVLVAKVRWRPFVGGGYKAGEWVWRVERWQWEDPNEQTWVPYQERPYYALTRERLDAASYRAKKIVYARHLGGLVLTDEQSTKDIGGVHVPVPQGGVYAVEPNGERIAPVFLKGEGKEPGQ